MSDIQNRLDDRVIRLVAVRARITELTALIEASKASLASARSLEAELVSAGLVVTTRAVTPEDRSNA